MHCQPSSICREAFLFLASATQQRKHWTRDHVREATGDLARAMAKAAKRNLRHAIKCTKKKKKIMHGFRMRPLHAIMHADNVRTVPGFPPLMSFASNCRCAKDAAHKKRMVKTRPDGQLFFFCFFSVYEKAKCHAKRPSCDCAILRIRGSHYVIPKDANRTGSYLLRPSGNSLLRACGMSAAEPLSAPLVIALSTPSYCTCLSQYGQSLMADMDLKCPAVLATE